MSSVMSIAVSGMMAAQRRLEVSASNVANVSATGPLDAAPDDVRAAYAALRADQTETAGGGTAVTVRRASPATIAVPDPGSPFANGDGLVAAPNVDFATEAVEQLVARYSFAANAAVIRAEDKMMKSLFDMKA
jgi:flagellar basal-body rod protein FlgC